MRRVLVPLFAVPLLAAAVLFASGCGVTANTTAAVVGDQSISTDTVDELTRDAAFVTYLQAQPVPADESVLPGDPTRSVLLWEIKRAALDQELVRWDVEVSDQDLEQIRTQLSDRVGQMPKDQRPSTTAVEALARYFAARTALEARFADLDPENEDDLRRIYDGVPALWDQLCVVVVTVPEEDSDLVQDALAEGSELEDVPDTVEGAQLGSDPRKRCISRVQLGQDLLAEFDRAGTGRTTGPVAVAGAEGTALFFRVDGTANPSLEEAAPRLAQIAQGLAQPIQQGQPNPVDEWVSLVVNDNVEINPRYGSSIGVSAGQVKVLPPEAPPTTLPIQLPGIGGQQPASP